MNKNLFIYSFKYLAVLLALVTFSSCERDEFTEQDAFDLQQAQLDAQDAREQAALAAQDQRIMNMAMFRRSMDSLTRLNSGGKVFYTVNVVPGGSSAFASGRFEEIEGLDGATVTVSQLGGAVVEQKTTVGGLASFEMYSGEVTVNVEAPNHTDVNYTANLTPDGGVPNGALIYVGNVIPVFDDPNNPGAGSEDNLATVTGFAFAELDITAGNNQEESVPDGTKVRAFIDVDNDVFKDRYIREANTDEAINSGGQPTSSGAIQRFAYEEAASTTGSTVTSPLNSDTAPDGGEYTISIGATASGLPIMMKFEDFAADRTYFFSDSDGDDTGLFGSPGSKRFIYTQATQGATNQVAGGANAVGGQAPTPIGRTGTRNFGPFNTSVEFDFVQTEATATATVTGGTSLRTVTGPTVEIGGVQYNQYIFTGTIVPAALRDATVGTQPITIPATAEVFVGDDNRGAYFGSPTVVFPAPTDAAGVQATGIAVLGPQGESESTVDTGSGTVSGATSENNLRPVVAILVTNAGSGYSDNPSTSADDIVARFVRGSYTGTDAAGLPIPNGNGTIRSTASGIGYVQIIDGGFGYTDPAGAGPYSGVGNPTGVNPTAVFNNTGDPEGQAPSGGVGAMAQVVVDRNVGTVTQVDIPTVAAAGSGYVDPIINIVNGSTVSLADNDEGGNQVDGANAIVFFETNGSGGLRFADGTTVISTPSATAPPATPFDNGLEGGTGLRLQQSAIPYALVPNVIVTATAATINFDGAGTPAVGFELPEVRARIDDQGRIVELFIANPGTGFGNIDGIDVSGFTVSVVPIAPRATAQAFLSTGGGVGNYVLTNYGTPARIYSNTLGTGFNYVTAINNGTGVQEFEDQDGNSVPSTSGDISANSDFRVVFAPPAGGGTAAQGFPVFEQGGANVVGIVITNVGSGYAQGEEPSFWIIPNGLSLAEYADGTAIEINNASARVGLSGTRLTITITDGGLGYAIRPEFTLFGGNRSSEDLAAINNAINADIRGRLNFNGAGTITNTAPLVYTGTVALPFTAANIAADPITVNISVERLEGIFNTEANYPTSADSDTGPTGPPANNFTGGILVNNGAVNYAGPEDWDFYAADTPVTPVNPLGPPASSIRQMFNDMEAVEFSDADRVGTNGVTNANLKFITAPTYRVLFAGAETGGEGITVLDPATADIVGFNASATGSIPPNFLNGSFFVPSNNSSTTGLPVAGSTTGARTGERFRTIGGGSNFEVFSGLTYIRDVNYGTGIELE